MKTTFNYDHYYLYNELVENLNHFNDKYPTLFKMESILKIDEKHDIYAITLSDNSKSASEKPGFYIDANTHAGEVTGSMAAMHTIDYLLTNYESDDNIKTLFKNYAIYVIPKIAVTGSEKYLNSAYHMRSVDRDYNTNQKGLKMFDVNEDGVLTMMRIKNPLGAWKKSLKHPLLMEKRMPDEIDGEFYNVYAEGINEDYDGLNIEVSKPLWGLDFNRNYPFGWFSEVRQPGAGVYPLSNPENKAVVDFVINHPNIGGVLSHHTSGGVILYPPGTKASKAASKMDMNFYQTIGKMATAEMGYPVVNIFDKFMIDQDNYSSGAFDDWCYQTMGILAYTVELWDLMGKTSTPTDWENLKDESIEVKIEKYFSQIEWASIHAKEDVRIWQEFDHPQFGKVEIGGINHKFVQQNPPTSFLLEEVEKATKFSLRFIKTLPLITIDNVEVKKVSDNIYEVSSVITNNGYLPTFISEEAKNLKVNKPIKIELLGDYEALDTSTKEINELGGFGTISTTIGLYGGITTSTSLKQQEKLVWLIKADENTELTIKVNSEKAGNVTMVVIL